MIVHFPHKENSAAAAFKNNETGDGGFYPIGSNRFWHGGVHLTNAKAVAVMDGEVIAYRINEKMLTNTVNGVEVDFSSSFVLIKHQHPNATSPEITFYSLYMHLLPWSEYTPSQKDKAPLFFKRVRYRVQGVDKVLYIRSEGEWVPDRGNVVGTLAKGDEIFFDKSY